MAGVGLAERTCCYCLETLVVPVVLNCLHNVCLTCAEKMIEEVNTEAKLKLEEEESLRAIVEGRPSGSAGSTMSDSNHEGGGEGDEAHNNNHSTLSQQPKRPIVPPVRHRKIKCPVCWQDTQFEVKKGADALSKNSELRQRLEEAVNPANEKRCEVCEENRVEFECETACGEICGACHANLHRGRFKHHRVVDATSGRIARELTCQQHEKPLDVFCFTCEGTICDFCRSMGEHQGHHCRPLNNAYDEEINDIESLIKHCMEHNVHIREGMKRVEGTMGQLEENYQDAQMRVAEHFNLLALELDRRKASMLGQLNQLKEFKAKKLKQQQQELEHHYETMYTALSCVRHAMQRTSRRDVMGVRNMYKNRLKSIPLYPTPVSMAESDTFQYRLSVEEDVDSVQKMGQLEFAPRITGTLFPFKRHFDTNGVLYWVGKQYGASASYLNPAALGLITVTSSSCEHGSEESAIQHICAADPRATFMSADEMGGWLEIHLGAQYVLCPTHYTLRNCTINPGHALCNWDFEASLDAGPWVLLRRHIDDNSLAPTRGSVASWPLESTQSFNRFRVRTTGPNQHVQSIAVFHYLMLAGMELYGYVNKAAL